ncbi:12216_t:CDS:1 [Ambispora gerdemannii]|uniref:12216_t:CDS:1 n=1 Tax=Ambispora gerdemannii TaxID=144530 RepID=A0A9N8WG68_9GLOM|nr:12216_t:CDS:1 [Ambispora gerdemannii]
MAVTSLPVDLLSPFLKPLATDKKSMYNCLLVSRLWCRTIVPYLWRNPFQLIIYDRQNRSKTQALLKTYFICLENDKKSSLLQEFKLDALGTLSDLSSPTFQYQCYLENLPDSRLLSSIGSWFTKPEASAQDRLAQSLCFKALFEMFVRDAKNLKVLELWGIFWNLSIDNTAISEIIHAIQIQQTKLKQLKISFRNVLISNEKVIRSGKQMSGIVESQKKLESIIIDQGGGKWMDICLNALTAQTASLEEITFKECSFARSFSLQSGYFEKFVNLRKVEFLDCEGLNDEFLTSLSGQVNINMDTKTIVFMPNDDIKSYNVFDTFDVTRQKKICKD